MNEGLFWNEYYIVLIMFFFLLIWVFLFRKFVQKEKEEEFLSLLRVLPIDQEVIRNVLWIKEHSTEGGVRYTVKYKNLTASILYLYGREEFVKISTEFFREDGSSTYDVTEIKSIGKTSQEVVSVIIDEYRRLK